VVGVFRGTKEEMRGVFDGQPEAEQQYIERVVKINRVAKVVKGGRRFSFSALVVVGDGKGKVGAALGKANEVPEAIRKGLEKARNSMINVPIINSTIPHPVSAKYSAARVSLWPACKGTGVTAGGPMRAVMEAAGIQNILTKSMGSRNAINVVWATMKALRDLETGGMVARRRGIPLKHVFDGPEKR